MEDYLKTDICRKIKELRKKHGYSQEDVAIGLNMEQNTYSRMERGETKLDIERLQQIASFYKISVHDLIDELPPQP
jgi:transcriptional regulator with XRE-family HTH domain